jgi:hypothetical protein
MSCGSERFPAGHGTAPPSVLHRLGRRGCLSGTILWRRRLGAKQINRLPLKLSGLAKN